MNWKYLAGFFDGEGNIHMMQNNQKISLNVQIRVRIYSLDKQILWDIQEFLGFGKIYQKKKTGVSELAIISKKNNLKFLKGIYPHCLLKKPLVYYILDNYSFISGRNNQSFDFNKFHSFIKRKNVEKLRKNCLSNTSSHLLNNSQNR